MGVAMAHELWLIRVGGTLNWTGPTLVMNEDLHSSSVRATHDASRVKEAKECACYRGGSPSQTGESGPTNRPRLQ